MHKERILDACWWLTCWSVSAVATAAAGQRLSATFDEPYYIGRALEYWRHGSYGDLFKKGVMPLPPDVQGLPPFLWESWRGRAFDLTNDFSSLLQWARCTNLIFWALLLYFGWRAARSLGGVWAGRLAVLLLACEPSFMAHAGLATTDIAAAACLLGFLYYFERGRDGEWPRRVAIPALWFAAAILAKASGLLFGLIGMLVIELMRRRRTAPDLPGSFHQLWGRLRADGLPIAVAALTLVLLFCGSDWREEPSFVAWAATLPQGVVKDGMLWVAQHLKIFSNGGEALVQQTKHNVRGHGVYLAGQIAPRALWYYFPLLLTMKLTVGLLILPLALTAVRARSMVNWALMSALALALLSPLFRVQIGIRLVLPLVALAVVGLSAAAAQVGFDPQMGTGRRRIIGLAAAVTVAWSLWSSANVWPHGLCFVNELWGGTANGYLRVSDSNYDWGQGLPELAEWQKRSGATPLDVWYFGTDPDVQRLPARVLPLHALEFHGTEDILAQVRGHYLAASTTWLYGVSIADSHRRVAAFLRARRPIARTMTFFIYDFTHEPE